MLTLIKKADQTDIIPHDSIQIEQVQGDPLGKARFQVVDSGAQLALACQQEVIIIDENVAFTPGSVVPAAFSDNYATDQSSTLGSYTQTNNPGGSSATWTQNLSSGGGTTGLTTYIANAASSTIGTADKLYTIAGTPTTINTLVKCDGSTGWGEIVSQGSSSAWPAGGSIGNPSGKGFFLDTTVLNGQTIAAGNWSGNVRISANGSGTITANLTVRVYRYHPATTTYTLITSWTLSAQSWTTTINTVALPSTAASAIAFATGDKLYIDYWANITANTSGSGQQVRMNRLSTDTSGLTGDTNTQIVTPGYGPPLVSGNITASGGASALLLLNAWTAQYATLSAAMTTSDAGGLAFNVVNTSNYYELFVGDASSPTANTLQLYKTVSGTRSSIGSSASISFTRGSSHTIGVTTTSNGSGGTTIAVSFDSTHVLTYTDTSSPLGYGQVGLRNDTVGGASSSISTAFSATSNDVPALVASIPAHNYVSNNDFVYGSSGWTTSGSIGTITFPSNPTFGPGAKVTLSVSNAAVGSKQTYQDIPNGYVVIGQQYCFSAQMSITTAFTNADTFLEFFFLDVNGGIITIAKQTFTALTSGYSRVSVTGTAPANTATIRVFVGVETASTTNSGAVAFTALQFEPEWFPTRYTYPTPICDFLQADSITLPDGTATRFDRIFTGFITHLKATYDGPNRLWDVEATSLDGLLENVTLVNATYTSATDQSIIVGLVNNLSPLLLFANNSTLAPLTPQALAYRNVPVCVQGVTIDSIQYADATLREVVNSLTDQSGFLAGVDNYYNVFYYPPFYNAAPYGFSSSPDNTMTFAYYDWSIQYDGTQLQNALRVAGGTYEVQLTENFSAGDGTHNQFIVNGNQTAGFYLTYPSAGTQAIPTVVFGGVTQTTALDTGSTGFGTNQTLIQWSNTHIGIATAINAGTSISVTYTYKALVYILAESPDSIGQYGRPFYGKISDTTLVSNASAVVRGEAQLRTYAQPRITVAFRTAKLLSPGQVVEITSAPDGLSKAHFAMQKVTARYLGNGINEYEIQGGTYIDDFVDFFRNAQKAITRASHDPNAAIQQYNTLQQDSLSITDSLNIHT